MTFSKMTCQSTFDFWIRYVANESFVLSNSKLIRIKIVFVEDTCIL